MFTVTTGMWVTILAIFIDEETEALEKLSNLPKGRLALAEQNLDVNQF